MTYNANFYAKFTKKHINQAFVEACVNGNLDKVKFLLNSPELPHRANIHYNENTALHQACEHGHLHIMQYLLTSPELKDHADIHSKDNWTLTIACNEGHFEIVKYLLTSPELKEHSNYHVDQLRCAIRLEEFDIVDYLLNSSDLKENFNIHINNDSIFMDACLFGDIGTLQYLIHNLNIERTDDINAYLENPSVRPSDLSEKAKQMFELRELSQHLNQDLSENNPIKNRIKL